MVSKCDACGAQSTVKITYVRTTNGGVNLCETCLNDINRKNPALKDRIKLFKLEINPQEYHYLKQILNEEESDEIIQELVTSLLNKLTSSYSNPIYRIKSL